MSRRLQLERRQATGCLDKFPASLYLAQGKKLGHLQSQKEQSNSVGLIDGQGWAALRTGVLRVGAGTVGHPGQEVRSLAAVRVHFAIVEAT
jgi:hypothetical protein